MKNRRFRTSRPPALRASLEPLECRIAPALIVIAGADIMVAQNAVGNDALTVSATATDFVFFDPNGILAAAGSNAVQVDPNTVTVPLAGFTGGLFIDTDVGNDFVMLLSGLPTISGPLDVKSQAINPGQTIPALNVGGGGLVLTSGSPILIDTAITVDSNFIVLTAPFLAIGPNGNVSSPNGASIDFNADIIDIAPTAVVQSTPSAIIGISPITPFLPVDIGGDDRPGFLGLTNTELNRLSAGLVEVQTENAPINVTAPIVFPAGANFNLIAGAKNNVIFLNGSSINDPGGNVVLSGNGIRSGDGKPDVNASVLTLNCATAGIGTATNPLSIDTPLLILNSVGDGVKMFLDANSANVGLADSNASGATLTISGRTFFATADDILGEVNLTVNSTFDLNGFKVSVGALNGAGNVTNSNVAINSALDFAPDPSFPGVFSGVISGVVDVTKASIGKQTLTGKNTFNGLVTINGGVLQINSDDALGQTNNGVFIDGGTLRTTGNFTLNKSIVATSANGQPVLEVASGTLVVGGSISGNLQKTGPGKLQFGANFVGQAPVAPNSGTVTVGGTTISTTGSGNAVLTVVSDGMGGTRVASIELQDTKANSVLNIQSPTPITIDKIVSLDPADPLGTIKLGPTVTLGDGVNDTVADLDIRGSVKKLLLSDISAFTRFELGKGLAYLDTYKNKPKLNMNKVLGAGVVIDATGNGIPGDQAGSLGGGGLGKVTVNQWSDPGTIQTSQSIKSFKLNNGDCFVAFSLDPNHLGAATTANIGQMSVVNGAWGSSGSIIEGTVGSFSATEFLASADITAAGIKKLTMKSGDYAGTTTLTDPSAKALGTFSVNGNYLGLVTAAEGVVNVNVKGDFKGSLSAQFVGSISAYSFDGTTANPGDYHQIIATGGSLGALKTSVRGIKNFEINSSTVFGGFNIKWPGAPSGAVGIDNVVVAAGQINAVNVKLIPTSGATGLVGIQTSTFESAGSIGNVTSSHAVDDAMFAATTKVGNVLVKGDLTGSKVLGGTSLGGDGLLGGGNDAFTPGGSVGNVTVLGMFASSTIAAGVDPGMGLVYGDGDDVVGTSPLVTGTSKIGALVFGTLSGAMGTSSGATHSDAIEAAAIKSIKVGAAAAIKSFATAQYLDKSSDGEDMADVLVKLV